MLRDLDTLAQLQKWLDMDFLELNHSALNSTINGYAFDINQDVVGLNLYGIKKITNYSFLKDLKNLKVLNLNFTEITDFSFLEELENLTDLYLGLNHLTDISFLTAGKNLERVYLFDNMISDITVLKSLPKLKSVDLRNNRITRLPNDIWEYNLEIHWHKDYSGGMLLGGNPIETPPVQIVRQGRDAIKAYYRSIENEGEKKALNELRVFVVGDAGTGKSTLVNELLGGKYDETEEDTEGISISCWEVKTTRGKLRVRFWEVGGNETIYATHRLFLAQESLYILVMDGSRAEKSEYWFKYIESVCGNSPIIAVINKIDKKQGSDVNRRHLTAKYKNIKGFYPVSCRNHTGIHALATGIIQVVASMPVVNTAWSISWFNVKTRLESMTGNFLSLSQYNMICAEERIIEDSDRLALAQFLHDLGVILHFKTFKRNEAYIFKVEWLTAAVYKIMNAPGVTKMNGVLFLTALDEILKPETVTDFIYSKEEYPFIIEIMTQLELCLPLNENMVLIPDLLPVQEMGIENHIIEGVHYVLVYGFLPRCIMPRFIMKMYSHAVPGKLWRSGMVLEEKSIQCRASIQADEESGKIFINVYGEKRREFFNTILFIFREINSQFNNIEWCEQIPIPGSPTATISHNHLIWLEKNGFTKYAPDHCEKMIHVKELLADIDLSVYNEVLKQMNFEFQAILKLKGPQRGLTFGKFLNRLFRVFQVTILAPMEDTGSQLEGELQIGSDAFLIVARWQDFQTVGPDLNAFAIKVSTKAMGAYGVFINLAGFSEAGLKGFTNQRESPVIGIDSNDILTLLDQKKSLQEILGAKLANARKTGAFH